MALVGVELETLVSEPDALTIRPPPCVLFHCFILYLPASYKIYVDGNLCPLLKLFIVGNPSCIRSSFSANFDFVFHT